MGIRTKRHSAAPATPTTTDYSTAAAALSPFTFIVQAPRPSTINHCSALSLSKLLKPLPNRLPQTLCFLRGRNDRRLSGDRGRNERPGERTTGEDGVDGRANDNRIGVLETSVKRLGMVLESIQSDILQVNKGTKEVLMKTEEDIHHNLMVSHNLLQKMRKEQDDMRRNLSDQATFEDRLDEMSSVISAQNEKINLCLQTLKTGSVQTRHRACGDMLTSMPLPFSVEDFVHELCSSRGGSSCLIVCRPRPFAGYEFVNIQDARRAYRFEERPESMVVAIDSYGWVMRHEGSDFWVKNIVTGERLELPALVDIPEVARGRFLIEAEGHLHAVVAYLDDDQGLQVFYHSPNSNNWRGHHYNVLGVNENSRVDAVLIYGGKIHIFFENQYMSLSPNPQAPNGVRVTVDLLIGADAIHPICTSFVIAEGEAYLFLLDGNFAYRFYRINQVTGRLDLVPELGGAIYVADGSSTGVSIPHRTSFEENKTFIAGMRTPGEPREECCQILRTTQITSTLKECMDLICNCNVCGWLHLG